MAFDAGWSSPVARQAHNLKVVGSNPTPATIARGISRAAACIEAGIGRRFAIGALAYGMSWPRRGSIRVKLSWKRRMQSISIPTFATLGALVLSATATPAEPVQPDRANTAGPISAELAKKCRELAIKAHPTERAGTTPCAQAQRDYFQECIAKRGNMPE
jgi:hypothetical protein